MGFHHFFFTSIIIFPVVVRSVRRRWEFEMSGTVVQHEANQDNLAWFFVAEDADHSGGNDTPVLPCQCFAARSYVQSCGQSCIAFVAELLEVLLVS